MKINMKKGFTLIELLIVVAIIGILASIVVVSLTGQGSKASDAALKSNLRSVATAVSNEAANNLSSFQQSTVCTLESVKSIMDTIFETVKGQASNTVTTGSGTTQVNMYIAPFVDATDAAAAVAQGTAPVTGNTIRYGCASNKGGWAVWGQLSEDSAKYFCLDSYGSVGTSKLTSVPETAAHINTAKCDDGTDGVGS